MDRIYLDHNATSPLRPASLRTMQECLARPAGNPSSLHAEGRAARARLEEARVAVAALAHASPKEVVWTSGGSEAAAAAIHGVTGHAPAQRRRIVVSAIEHSCVLESARAAAGRGFELVEVACEPTGRIDPARFVESLTADTALAALQAANPETGVLQPVDEVGTICAERGIPFLVDAVQAAGKVPIDFEQLPADLLAISSHKLGGPQGAGALIVRDGVVLAPLVPGVQERRRRGGTEGVAAIAGFGAAAAAARPGLQEEGRRRARMRDGIEAALHGEFPDVRIHGSQAPRVPGTLLFEIPGASGESLVIALDLVGIAVSTGSACASGAVEPSHVLRAMGFDERSARGAVRVSLGWSTSDGDIERFLDVFPAIARRARGAGPPGARA